MLSPHPDPATVACKPSRLPLPTAPRLCRATLPALRASVHRPGFDLRQLRPGILHIGCGVFHRAHQAWMTQRGLESELSLRMRNGLVPPPAWGIVSASLRTPESIDSLWRQDGLYTVTERAPDYRRVEVVGTLRQLLFVPDESEAFRRWFADPKIRIVTLTITTAGYCTDAATGRLDLHHAEIHADLREPAPRSAIGWLVRGLADRRGAGLPAPVILACDNLPSNGAVLRQACIDFAALQADGLAQWISHHVQFPNTMVDRIVPEATEEHQVETHATIGLLDAAPVLCEPYCQWVIEHFDGPHPPWAAAGAEWVPDVAPWEASKLRLLNGGHLAIAYLGLLAGLDTVAEAMAVPEIADFARRFMLDEQCPTLPPSDHDILDYAQQLLARWRNPFIGHRLDRVGRDGSGKLPSRLLASLRDNLAVARPAPCTVLAIAAWMLCISSPGPSGGSVVLEDRLAARLSQLGRSVGHEAGRLVRVFLQVPEIFGEDLRLHPTLQDDLARALSALQTLGPRAALTHCLAGGRP